MFSVLLYTIQSLCKPDPTSRPPLHVHLPCRIRPHCVKGRGPKQPLFLEDSISQEGAAAISQEVQAPGPWGVREKLGGSLGSLGSRLSKVPTPQHCVSTRHAHQAWRMQFNELEARGAGQVP